MDIETQQPGQPGGADFEPEKELPSLADICIVIDGLDGSGKGTLAEYLANRGLEGYNFIVDYPQYGLPWGKVLYSLLHENDQGLSINDRMLVYALNRLETAHQLRWHMEKTRIVPDIKINLIFDRFATSNIITAAYYYKLVQDKWRTFPLENPADEQSSLKDWILPMYDHMMQIDAEFMQILGVSDAVVFVPMLDERISMESLLNDQSRSGVDMYETASVQGLARKLYRIVAEAHPERLHLYDQHNGDKRMSTEEQAMHILGALGLSEAPAGTANRVNYAFYKELVDRDAVNALLERFGSEELKRLNPYAV
ncbi:MAG: hypothetical protein QY318_01910 [Candidatus Dojkabacteria bacterium]|nr:MAG: hypothetical protein QY318_01910 [Candidatus Dojkabacteria bacterium]